MRAFLLIEGRARLMNHVTSGSDPQRTYRQNIDSAHEQAPLDVTRSRTWSLAATDEMQEHQRRVFDHEMRIRDALLASEEAIRAGQTMSYDAYRRKRLAGPDA